MLYDIEPLKYPVVYTVRPIARRLRGMAYIGRNGPLLWATASEYLNA